MPSLDQALDSLARVADRDLYNAILDNLKPGTFDWARHEETGIWAQAFYYASAESFLAKAIRVHVGAGMSEVYAFRHNNRGVFFTKTSVFADMELWALQNLAFDLGAAIG